MNFSGFLRYPAVVSAANISTRSEAGSGMEPGAKRVVQCRLLAADADIKRSRKGQVQ